jgi:uncharacterized phage-associated protein
MESRIAYRVDFTKAIELIVWIANKKPDIDIYHVAKILYYAEKTHLNKYGRPIVGATYIRMPFGQVPSEIRDLITKNAWMVEPDDLDRFSVSVEVNKKPHHKLKPLRRADMDYFSDTDIECLEKSLNRYADMSFDELKVISRRERSYIETEPNQPIDYSLMVDNDNPNKDEILEELCDTAHYVRM